MEQCADRDRRHASSCCCSPASASSSRTRPPIAICRRRRPGSRPKSSPPASPPRSTSAITRRRGKRSTRSGSIGRCRTVGIYNAAGRLVAGYGRDGGNPPADFNLPQPVAGRGRHLVGAGPQQRRPDRHGLPRRRPGAAVAPADPLSRHRPAGGDGGPGHRRARRRAGRAAPRQPQARGTRRRADRGQCRAQGPGRRARARRKTSFARPTRCRRWASSLAASPTISTIC